MRVIANTLVLCFSLAWPVLAHHGGAVEFRQDQQRGPVTGVATTFAFSFPHPHVEFTVKDENGTVQEWVATFQPTPTNLRLAGWTRNTIKPGDTLTVSGFPHRVNPHILGVQRIEINGKLTPIRRE